VHVLGEKGCGVLGLDWHGLGGFLGGFGIANTL